MIVVSKPGFAGSVTSQISVRGIAEVRSRYTCSCRLGQLATVAYAHHLRPAASANPGSPGMLGQVAGFFRIGHIDDGRAVVLPSFP